jgi:DNA transformation protein
MTAQVFLSAQFFFGQNLFIPLRFTELAMFLYFSGICTLTMGTKGEQHTGDAKISAELFCERLSRIAGITFKKMFGGYGIAQSHGKMPYFSIPESVFNDPEILVNWAQESIDISKK